MLSLQSPLLQCLCVEQAVLQQAAELVRLIGQRANCTPLKLDAAWDSSRHRRLESYHVSRCGLAVSHAQHLLGGLSESSILLVCSRPFRSSRRRGAAGLAPSARFERCELTPSQSALPRGACSRSPRRCQRGSEARRRHHAVEFLWLLALLVFEPPQTLRAVAPRLHSRAHCSSRRSSATPAAQNHAARYECLAV